MISRMIQTLLFTLLSVNCISVYAEERVFRNDSGKEICAEIFKARDDKVWLNLKGRKYIFPVSTLSKLDEIFVRKWAETHVMDKSKWLAGVEKDLAGKTVNSEMLKVEADDLPYSG